MASGHGDQIEQEDIEIDNDDEMEIDDDCIHDNATGYLTTSPSFVELELMGDGTTEWVSDDKRERYSDAKAMLEIAELLSLERNWNEPGTFVTTEIAALSRCSSFVDLGEQIEYGSEDEWDRCNSEDGSA